MIAYIILYAFITILALTLWIIKSPKNNIIIYIWRIFSLFILVLFVGFRYKVGGDWSGYLIHYLNLKVDNFSDLQQWDPGYVIIELLSKYLDLGIYGVNTICAILFFYGFNYFIKSLRINFSFALLISFPYLIMVVVNGYTRQGVAVGLVMAMYGAIYKNDDAKALLFYIVSILFHKTAMVAGLIILLNRKINFKLIFLFFIATFVFGLIFLDQGIIMVKYYLINKMQSGGAFFRISLNVFAGALFMVFHKKWKKCFDDYDIVKYLSVVSFVVFVFTLISGATTVGDRVLLYFYPLQIIVFYRLFILVKSKALYFIFLLLCYWGVLLIWLHFATHRMFWIPYDNLLFKLFC